MALSNPTLTVVTAVFNGENFIEETIKSVFDVTKNVDFEYIVVNDGSTDATLDILLKYENRIRIIDKPNSGESDSVTVAFKEAKGDYLIVVSADDPLFSEKLFENVFNDFKFDQNLVAVYPDWRMIGPEGEILREIRVPEYSDELLIGMCVALPGPGVIFRKSAALKIGGRRKKWTFVGDYDFWLRLSRVGEIRHRPEVLAQWRYHSGSTSIIKRGPEMAKERIAVIEEFLSENVVEKNLERMALGSAYFLAARLVVFDRNVPGKKYLLKSFQKRRGWVKEAKVIVIIFILFTPISSVLLKLVSKFIPALRTFK